MLKESGGCVDTVDMTRTHAVTTTRPPSIDSLPYELQAKVLMLEALATYSHAMQANAAKIAEYNSKSH